MMDELELLKKDWQKKEEHLPKLSYDAIHQMTWKKSSSIVKWILIISILEITLPFLLYLLPSLKEGMAVYEKSSFNTYYLWVSILYYIVVFYFVFLFYKRYREISVLDDAKNLMRKIMKTRRTVKYYIIFSLSMVLVTVVMMMMGVYFNNDFISFFEEMGKNQEHVSPEKFKVSLILSIAVMGGVMTLVAGAIYFLLYGLLLRKLKKNYTELRRLEV